jgi:lipoprotein-releasing system permease protein
MSEYDATIIYMPLEEAQLYFNAEGMVQSIELFVDNPDDIDELRPKVEAAAGRQIAITDWRQRNQTFFSALQVERNVMFMILTLIVLVAALNIISGLIMLVKDKGSDIAILRTMGATSGAIMRIFFMTGCGDRPRRHLCRRACSACWSASTSRRSASSSPGCRARCCSIRSSISSASCRPR